MKASTFCLIVVAICAFLTVISHTVLGFVAFAIWTWIYFEATEDERIEEEERLERIVWWTQRDDFDRKHGITNPGARARKEE